MLSDERREGNSLNLTTTVLTETNSNCQEVNNEENDKHLIRLCIYSLYAIYVWTIVVRSVQLGLRDVEQRLFVKVSNKRSKKRHLNLRKTIKEYSHENQFKNRSNFHINSQDYCQFNDNSYDDIFHQPLPEKFSKFRQRKREKKYCKRDRDDLSYSTEQQRSLTKEHKRAIFKEQEENDVNDDTSDQVRHVSYLSDFIQENHTRKKSCDKYRKRISILPIKPIRWVIHLAENLPTVIKNTDEKLLNNYTSINFEFFLPFNCSFSLADCDIEDIPIIDGQSTPPLHLLDFSSYIRTILLARGDLSRRKDLARALIFMKYQRCEEVVNIKMNFAPNIASSNSPSTIKPFHVVNFKELIDIVKQTINDWLKKAILINVLDICDLQTGCNRVQVEIKLGDLVNENLGISPNFVLKEKIYYLSILEYWNRNKIDLNDVNIMMVSKNNRICNSSNIRSVVCNICYMKKDNNEIIALKCNHEFCIACWKSHLRISNSDMCPEYNCVELVCQVKTCPNCKRMFEKMGGCDSMSCICGIAFCWKWSKEIKGNHHRICLSVVKPEEFIFEKIRLVSESYYIAVALTKSLKNLTYKSQE
ncbi:DgyrCDS11381 [Dimorphilus gyrociliatus]|uniref:DgyrCDS11381 n=1 Tax=Dimorphilus gyrociliatus TaxID=2664684 RepID=A0A7I8W466_9ANNE|nr:DgyrCDS11381 [Dimorphilus gyrociliatus]